MAEDPKVEEVTGGEGAQVDANAAGEDQKLNRNEKKARKVLKAAGMKELTGFTRIALRKRDGTLFVMNDPDVFQSSESSYACFGELKYEDQNQRMQQMEAKKFQEQQAQMMAANAGKEEQKAASTPAADEAPESEEGVSSGHIDMVMSHTSCTRNEAIRALRETNDDMIQAVMKLTQ